MNPLNRINSSKQSLPKIGERVHSPTAHVGHHILSAQRRRSSLDYAKMMSAKIKNMKSQSKPIGSWLELAFTPIIYGQQIDFNEFHWTSWFSAVSHLATIDTTSEEQSVQMLDVYTKFYACIDALNLSPRAVIVIQNALTKLNEITIVPPFLFDKLQPPQITIEIQPASALNTMTPDEWNTYLQEIATVIPEQKLTSAQQAGLTEVYKAFLTATDTLPFPPPLVTSTSRFLRQLDKYHPLPRALKDRLEIPSDTSYYNETLQKRIDAALWDFKTYLNLPLAAKAFFPEQWELWFQQFPKKLIDKSNPQNLLPIYQKLTKALQQGGFSLSSLATISQTLSVLQRETSLPENLVTILAEKSLDALKPDSPEEAISQLVKGIEFLYDVKTKKEFFNKITEVVPPGIFTTYSFANQVALLYLFSKSKLRREEWNGYLIIAANNFNANYTEYLFSDMLLLLKTLGQLHQDTGTALEEIQMMEMIFADELNFSQDPHQIAHFLKTCALINYLPNHILLTVTQLIDNPIVDHEIKILYFESLGILGYTEILPRFERFINKELPALSVECSIESLCKREHALRLLKAMGCLYPIVYPFPIHLKPIIQSVLNDFHSFFYKENKLGCYETLVALGFKKQIEAIYTPQAPKKEPLSFLQIEMTKYIASKIHPHPYRKEFSVSGRNVDLIISRGTKRKAVVCEIDGPTYHFCCNDFGRRLGTDTIREKFLIQLGYLVFSFVPGSFEQNEQQAERLVQLLNSTSY